MQTNKTYTGYIGTYTKGNSKGIYSFILDSETATISDIKEVAQLENPTYLNISKNNQYLYAVNKEGEDGGVSGYSIDPVSRELTAINSQMLPGSSPCHVSMDSSGKLLFTANYHKGTVASYLIDPIDGTIQPLSSVIEHVGHGPDPRQEKPHVHYAGVTPDEKYLAVVDLGIDALLTYEIAKDGKITEKSRLVVPAGSGPRHLTFHPNQKWAYLMTEFSSEVIVLQYNELDGSFFVVQTISTLPGILQKTTKVVQYIFLGMVCLFTRVIVVIIVSPYSVLTKILGHCILSSMFQLREIGREILR